MTVTDRLNEILPVRTKFDGDAGIGLYLGPPDEAAGPDEIEYRAIRLVEDSDHDDGVYVGDYTPDADTFLNDATVAIAKTPDDTLDFELPADYLGKSFWVDIRTHAAGLENETLFRPQRITAAVDGEQTQTIDGSAILLEVVKRDAGGVLIRFEYVAALSGVQPAQFVVSKVSGLGTIADVSETARDGRFDYEITVTGLTDGEEYVFELAAKNEDVEAVLIASIEFTADATGPAAITVDFEEET